MKQKLLLFGIGDIADTVMSFANRNGYEVVAFVIDQDFLDCDSRNGLPVVSFDNVEEEYSNNDYEMFVALGYSEQNFLRARKCEQVEAKGYKLATIINRKDNLTADCEIGKNCFIGSSELIHPYTLIGNNVFIWSGSIIGHHSRIENNCWLGLNCTVEGNVVIGENSILGMRTALNAGIVIKEKSTLY